MIIKIRQAQMEDYKEVVHLYKAFIGDNPTYKKIEGDSFHEVLKSPTSYMYVAEDKGKLVGLMLLTTRFVVRMPKHIMQLEELFVAEPYRKHGVGTKLMETMEEKARDLDCCRIYIESNGARKTAHKFYEELGYRNRGYYFKKEL